MYVTELETWGRQEFTPHREFSKSDDTHWEFYKDFLTEALSKKLKVTVEADKPTIIIEGPMEELARQAGQLYKIFVQCERAFSDEGKIG